MGELKKKKYNKWLDFKAFLHFYFISNVITAIIVCISFDYFKLSQYLNLQILTHGYHDVSLVNTQKLKTAAQIINICRLDKFVWDHSIQN